MYYLLLKFNYLKKVTVIAIIYLQRAAQATLLMVSGEAGVIKKGQ